MPLKRHTTLQPISREHHQFLLLCWKIRTGLMKGVSPVRIKKYTLWFYNTYITKHFNLEEKIIFKLLNNNNHELVKKAIDQHQELHKLFLSEDDSSEAIKNLERKFEQHIRFEERVLFEEIQNKNSEVELAVLNKSLAEVEFIENYEDVFWK